MTCLMLPWNLYIKKIFEKRINPKQNRTKKFGLSMGLDDLETEPNQIEIEFSNSIWVSVSQASTLT